MSAFGDSESRKSSISEIDIEEFGDDVSIIDRSIKQQWGTVIIKVCLGLIFIGFATGCIIYSVLTSDEYQHPTTPNTTFFAFNISQYCESGVLTWTNRTGSINDYDTISTGISWIQDASRQRIFHRIGIADDDSDWMSTYYVFNTHSFLVTKAGCNRSTQGYDDFIRGFGLGNIRQLRSEAFKIDDESVKVKYYEGEPARDIRIDGLHPAIARAYSAIDRSFDYGWEYIFAQGTDDTGLFRKEYWFPKMKAGIADNNIFENVPDSCYKSKNSQQ